MHIEFVHEIQIDFYHDFEPWSDVPDDIFENVLEKNEDLFDNESFIEGGGRQSTPISSDERTNLIMAYSPIDFQIVSLFQMIYIL